MGDAGLDDRRGPAAQARHVSADERWLDADGPAAPPRRNGELAFEAPWESRLFGVTLALVERGAFPWRAFRRRLIDAIARWEERHAGRPEAEYRYWDLWLEALEALLSDTGLCGTDELDARTRLLAARPPGHDHDHPA